MAANDEPPLNSYKPLSVGLNAVSIGSATGALSEAVSQGFDYICYAAFHERYYNDTARAATQPQADADAFMPGQRWSTSVVPTFSPRASVTSSTEDWDAIEEIWRQELSWFAYLSVPAVLLPSPPAGAAALARYARLVSACTANHSTHLWMPVALQSGTEEDEGWRQWNAVRLACNHRAELSPVLVVVGGEMPTQGVLDRWMGEPLKAIIWHTHAFIPNSAGYPVLPKVCQELLQLGHRHGIQAVLSGAAVLPRENPGHGGYGQYLRHCASQALPHTPTEAYEAPFFDRLQAPLQPLGDNLAGETYEVFERDTPKYAAYQRAIEVALTRIAHSRPETADITLMVVGAGRGPLVLRALAAAAVVGVSERMRVVAVEKNPNAVITLRELQRTHAWGNRVTIHAADMRTWSSQGGAACDILVSELLGSFGDNELSPECLDGVLHVLRPSTAQASPVAGVPLIAQGGLCIPQAYTSFLAPVTAYKAWSNARAYREAKYMETPYVVRLSRACTLDAPQPTFTFAHTSQGDARTTDELLAGLARGNVKPCSAGGVADNRRYACLRFTSAVSALVHGLVGYFDCTLTDYPLENAAPPTDIYSHGQRMVLSTLPSNHTPSMSSWFPIFFPLREPVTVQGGEVLEAHVWRCVSMTRRCVWYEWQLSTATTTSHIHNAEGSAYTIKL